MRRSRRPFTRDPRIAATRSCGARGSRRCSIRRIRMDRSASTSESSTTSSAYRCRHNRRIAANLDCGGGLFFDPVTVVTQRCKQGGDDSVQAAMKQKSWVALLAIGPALLLAEEKSTCPVYVPAPPPTALYHSLSMQTEAVAPSARVRAVRPPASASVFPQVVNFIDNDVFNKMRQDGVVPTAIAGDEEFLRRVTLDLTGQIPDSATVQAFVADTTADKRAKKIDQLLASDAFVDRWTMWFGDLVQNVQVSANSREYYIGRNTYYNYIHDSIQSAKPYDQMVRELISGKGDNFASGAANYWVRQTQANGPIQDQYDNLSAASGQEFLGMPFLCLSCHSGLGHLELVNTYLKSKTRYDFWGEAAFFARTRAQRIAYQDPATKNNVNKYDVEDNTTGAYQLNTTSGNKTPRQPVNGESTVNPAFLLTGEQPRSGEAYRDALGRMLTAHQQF